MKIVKPKIKNELKEIDLSKVDNKQDWYDLLVRDCRIDSYIQEGEFNGCRFIHVDFSNQSIHRCQFLNLLI